MGDVRGVERVVVVHDWVGRSGGELAQWEQEVRALQALLWGRNVTAIVEALVRSGALTDEGIRQPTPADKGEPRRTWIADTQFIITGGDHHDAPVGPFLSEGEAHAYYQRNQPHSKTNPYLTPPTIVRLLRPAPVEP